MLSVCIVFWVSVAAGRVVRRLWPVRRRISRLQRIELAAGATAVAMVAVAGDHPVPREMAAVLLAAAGAREIVAVCRAFVAQRRRGIRIFRRRPAAARRPSSHLVLWVDAAGAAATTSAVGHWLADSSTHWPWVVAWSAIASAIVESVKLERGTRHERLSAKWSAEHPIDLRQKSVRPDLYVDTGGLET
jgi:hypothetical protein